MDKQNVKPLQNRTDAKLRYAHIHLGELKSLDSLNGGDFDRAHQESFLFHLFGARDALLAELNYYYGTHLAFDALTPGRLREALKQRGEQGSELHALYELEQDEASWYRQTKDMRDHSMHIQGVPRVQYLGGEDDGKVKLKNPRTGKLTEGNFIEEFEDWLTHMGNLVFSLRQSALSRMHANTLLRGESESS